MVKSILPMFSSRTVKVSVLKFRSLNHFEFIFVYGVKYFILILHVAVWFSKGPFIEETRFSPFYLLAYFIIDWLTISASVYFGALCSVSVSAILTTAVQQAPLSFGFPRQKSWRGLPFSPPGALCNPKNEPVSLASLVLAGRFFTTVPPRKPLQWLIQSFLYYCSCLLTTNTLLFLKHVFHYMKGNGFQYLHLTYRTEVKLLYLSLSFFHSLIPPSLSILIQLPYTCFFLFSPE